MSANRVQEVKDRAARAAEEKKAKDLEAAQSTPIAGRPNVTPEVTTTDPVEMAKQDPRIGEQDVPPDQREDGYTAGIRHDQMEGVQSAAWINDLDEEEILNEQIANPTNTGVRADLGLDVAPEYVSPRTQKEMDRGRDAIGSREERRSATRRTSTSTETDEQREAREKREADKREADKQEAEKREAEKREAEEKKAAAAKAKARA